jgi:hypothetical protein
VITAFAIAQPPVQPGKKAEPGTSGSKSPLDDLLTQALRNSTDIQLAAAKVHEAEAQLRTAEATLRRAHTEVAQKVVETQQALDAQKQILDNVRTTYELANQAKGATSKGELQNLQRAVLEVKARVGQLQAQLDAVTGHLPGNVAGPVPPPAPATAPIRAPNVGFKPFPNPEMADRMRKALTMPVKITGDKVVLKDLVDNIRSQVPAVPILLDVDYKAKEDVQIDFKGELTLLSCFQLLSDTLGLKVFVRDYGFSVTLPALAPEDAMSLQSFTMKRD